MIIGNLNALPLRWPATIIDVVDLYLQGLS